MACIKTKTTSHLVFAHENSPCITAKRKCSVIEHEKSKASENDALLAFTNMLLRLLFLCCQVHDVTSKTSHSSAQHLEAPPQRQ